MSKCRLLFMAAVLGCALAVPSDVLAKSKPLAVPKCTVKAVLVPGRLTARMTATGGACKVGGKPVPIAKWAGWSAVVTDATGNVCTTAPPAGTGKSFVFSPGYPNEVVVKYMLLVAKTKTHVGGKFVVTVDKLVSGNDGCNSLTQPTISVDPDPSATICTFAGNPTLSLKIGGYAYQLGAIQCPGSFGKCSWQAQPASKQYFTPPGGRVRIYPVMVQCTAGYTAIPRTYLYTLQCGPVDMPGVNSFAIPYFWGSGSAWFDNRLETYDPSGNIIGSSPYAQTSTRVDVVGAAGVPLC